MTTYQSNIILKEVNNLITYSCRSTQSKARHFETMHRAIIKKHFKAFEVSMRENQDVIDLKVFVENQENMVMNLPKKQLEDFLKSCIENDSRSLSFYQHMLAYYNVVGNPNQTYWG